MSVSRPGALAEVAGQWQEKERKWTAAGRALILKLLSSLGLEGVFQVTAVGRSLQPQSLWRIPTAAVS